MLLPFVILTSLLSISLGQWMNPLYMDCGSKTGKVNSLEVVPCEGPSCTLHRGKNSTIKLGFQSNVFVQAGSVAVHGVIAHVPVPFSLDNSHICDFLTPSCPIQPNQLYMYTFSLLVHSSYPPIRLDIRWELRDDSGSDIACVQFPAQIHD
ncbi:hypothetical protein CRM22_006563 [Opisthorchis felineus]|uniref:MD-2-related lipid-recognition domain-containing protein n=1 Tax=Opisthorchis felineus TaxID=147828 RepID=A0A4S2LK87_OPIFE|nr:hypothetical protein CRM22_006563 [Opisthorchis felineus]